LAVSRRAIVGLLPSRSLVRRAVSSSHPRPSRDGNNKEEHTMQAMTLTKMLAATVLVVAAAAVAGIIAI
jgi:hypothetical protein